MRYEINLNGKGFHDHVIKEDGTLVTNKAYAQPVLITHINVIAPKSVSNNQYFALFALIMQLHRELNKPIVTGNVSWDEIVEGAKR